MKFMLQRPDIYYFYPVLLSAPPTVSREVAALRSGRKPTSSRWSRKPWSSIPYTLSRNKTMGALWSGQKLADMSGSVTDPSERDWDGERKAQRFQLGNSCRCEAVKYPEYIMASLFWLGDSCVFIRQHTAQDESFLVLEAWLTVFTFGLLTEHVWRCSQQQISEPSLAMLMQINQ